MSQLMVVGFFLIGFGVMLLGGLWLVTRLMGFTILGERRPK